MPRGINAPLSVALRDGDEGGAGGEGEGISALADVPRRSRAVSWTPEFFWRYTRMSDRKV